MSEPQEPRVVINDRRRIDPVTGAVRVPAGEQPAGTSGPTSDSPASDPASDSPADTAAGEQMSEHEIPVAEQPTAAAPTTGGNGDLASQLAERTEDLQRLSAEYANYRRRVDRDRSLVVDQAAERFALQLFPIIDDIERARDHGDLTGAFKVVADRVLGLVDGLGVSAFGKAGDPFDPALHEAVMHDTSSEVGVPTATTVLRQGFRRGDRVLRTAMVAVTDPESPAQPETTDGPGTAQAATGPGTAPQQPADDPAAG